MTAHEHIAVSIGVPIADVAVQVVGSRKSHRRIAFRGGQTFVAAARYAESSPNAQNLKPKPQGVPQPIDPANVPLQCSDRPLRTATNSRVVAYTVHHGHLRG